ncbi:MAG: hypothetical protein KatS3mg023_2443 [Armatimonadota bacterium]|nr:MAG: hypothetical protein KatS3mg023_2443 [Armatimonadota bacterium]
MKRQAFTLAEVLAATGLLLLVMIPSFPVLPRAREAARQSQCLDNVKQFATGILLYAYDYDEAIVPWFKIREYPGQPLNERFWIGLLQPYIHSQLLPPDPGKTYTVGGQPVGIHRCPSWSAERYMEGVNMPDCYPGELDPFWPPTQVFAHYGIVFQMASRMGAGTPENPYYHSPGSLCYPPGSGGLTRYMPELKRPAETILIGDGLTFLDKGPTYVLVPFGCESQRVHSHGSNFAFADGHARFIENNAERYLSSTTEDGRTVWYKRYFTFSMP